MLLMEEESGRTGVVCAMEEDFFRPPFFRPAPHILRKPLFVVLLAICTPPSICYSYSARRLKSLQTLVQRLEKINKLGFPWELDFFLELEYNRNGAEEMKQGKGLKFQVETIMLCCLLCGSRMTVGMIIGFYMKPYVGPADYEYLPTTHLALTPAIPPPCPASSSSSPALLKEWIAPSLLMHSMTDEELMWHASMVPRVADYPHKRVPKVAFMFLTRGPIPLGPFWEKFFKGHDSLFSIYVHGPPLYDVEASDCSVFCRRRIPSQAVHWGRSSMLDAERRLLANALLDFSNQRFVLVSESCIPLFNFSTIYDYLMGSNHSFVGVLNDPTKAGRGRYSQRMWPDVRLSDWRKGSQWFEVDRKLAVEIVSDRKYYALFRDHCTPPCYVDEHYLPTLVSKHYGSVNANRSLTFVDWSRGGSHPATFGRRDTTVRLLRRMRSTGRCGYNLNSRSVCFLLARKFSPTALAPLMRIGPLLMGFDP